jgi:hypothetical protein
VVGCLFTAGEETSRRGDGDDVASPAVGGRFVPRRPFKLGRDAPRKLAARGIREWEVRSLLESHVIVDVVEHCSRYVLLGRVAGRALMAVVADDELDDATVLVSVYEPDAARGWTPEMIDRILRGDGPEEPLR